MLTSADPTGGPERWTRTPVAFPGGFADEFDAVSCPSVSLCVAVTFQRRIVTATDPTGGTSAWSAASVSGGSGLPFNGVSCASTSLCVAADQDGALAISTRPTGGAGAWSVRPLSPRPLFDVACAASRLCAAVDANGDAFASADPAARGGWARARVDANNELSAVSCTSGERCVAVDRSGNVVVAPRTAASARVPHLAGTGRHTVRLRTGGLLVDAGLAVRCPAAGPACSIDGIWSLSGDSQRSLARAALRQRIAPGVQQNITFELTAKAAALLRKRKQLDAQMTFDVRAGRRGAVAQDFRFILT